MSWQHVLRRKAKRNHSTRFIDMESTEQTVYDDHGIVTILCGHKSLTEKLCAPLSSHEKSSLMVSFYGDGPWPKNTQWDKVFNKSVPAQEDKNISQYAD